MAKKIVAPKRIKFDEIVGLLDSPEYVKIRSYLWHNDNENPTREELHEALEHSYSPKPVDFDFSILAKETIAEVYYQFRLKEYKDAESKRKADARKRAGRK